MHEYHEVRASKSLLLVFVSCHALAALVIYFYCSAVLLKGVYIPYVHYEIYSILFGLIIINFAANKKSHLSLENRYLNDLGKISGNVRSVFCR